GCSNISA
ncbi:hypothetical protein KKC1_21390, partial [Calderihabitans maritimus]